MGSRGKRLEREMPESLNKDIRVNLVMSLPGKKIILGSLDGLVQNVLYLLKKTFGA